MSNHFAIEVRNESHLELVRAVAPAAFGDLTLDAVFGHFLVFNADDKKEGVFALVPPTAVGDYWDHIENHHTVMIKKLVGKHS